MNIATVASDTAWKNCDENIGKTRQHVADVMAKRPETDLILFPEISLMGFVTEPSNQDIAEAIGGHCVSSIKEIAKEFNVALVCGIIEENPVGKPFNSTFVVSGAGELLAVYRKNHLFTESTEPDVFTPGEELVTFELNGWKCGLSTCFDIRFPRLFEAYKHAGVELMLSGFNWVQGRNKPAIMENLVKARAHENQYFFVAVDRSGSDPNTTYYGKSVITNPYSEDIAEHDGIYAYAHFEKDDIEALAEALPLAGSFKSEYEML